MDALVKIENLSRTFNGRSAVEALDLSLERGEILGLLGPNGAGKSTSLRMICGDLTPSTGSIQICGHDLQKHPVVAKQQLGYLPERPPLHPDQRVDEYLADCARLRRLPKGRLVDAVTQTKQRCGLEKSGQRLIRNLSKGFQQRVGIAQAILHNPSVIIFDEPTDGLDPKQIDEVRTLILELAKNAGIILSSHILPQIQALCNRVLILQDGKTVYAGEITPPATTTLHITLRHSPELELIAALPTVADAERLHTDHFRIILKPHCESSELAAQIVELGWGLSELTLQTVSLEQIFLQATSGDNR